MYELSIKKGNLNHKRFNRTTYRLKIAVMFKVVRLPKKPEFFFAPLENQFHWDHFKYFQMLALLMVMAWGRRNISVLYRHLDDRWSIEVFFKDAEQLLGLGQYQNVSLEAAVTHLHLVCFAYALLTHVAITGESAKGKRKPVASMSTANLQNEVRRIAWDDLTDYLKQFSSGTQIVKELGRLLIAA